MQHPIENIMHTSMEHIKSLADVNTVIGSPIITAEGATILPVSKVTLGMLVGGGEYAMQACSKRERQELAIGDNYPFIGASTLGMSLTPLAFLTVKDGAVRVLPADQEKASDRLIDLVPQVIETAERLLNELTDCRSTKGEKGRCGCANDKKEARKPTEERPARNETYSPEYRYEREHGREGEPLR